MKVYKGISLSDQKIMFKNIFVWNFENGEKPKRTEYKKWILAFFVDKCAIDLYIKDMQNDIDLDDKNWLKLLNESYKRQILFLQTLLK